MNERARVLPIFKKKFLEGVSFEIRAVPPGHASRLQQLVFYS
jgi:hypothetical protein